MKLDFSMSKAGDKYIGELEFERKDGEYDAWTVIKRLDPSLPGSRPKGFPIYLIGTATNTGLLSDYYYKPSPGESEQKSLEEINADLEVLATDGEKYMSSLTRVPKKRLKTNPPFYAHNLYEKKTHGLSLKQMKRLYRMVSAGNQKAITFARNVLGIPFSESASQVKAVVYHHVRDLAEKKLGKINFRKNEEYAERWLKRKLRGNPATSHRERIAIDTVKHPMKGYFLGGPDLAESVSYLRSRGYTMAQLKRLNPDVEDILSGRKSILPNRRKLKRNPFGGETLRSFNQKYKGFAITVEIQPNTILATWTNGDILESDRFSGYELDEVFEEVKSRIDELKRKRK